MTDTEYVTIKLTVKEAELMAYQTTALLTPSEKKALRSAQRKIHEVLVAHDQKLWKMAQAKGGKK